MKVENEDGERKVLDWSQEVNIDPKFIAYHERFIGMMNELQCMWNGHLGRIG